MRPTSLYPALAAALLLGATATVSQAQGTTGAAHRDSRVVATYDFGAKRRAITFPRTVVVEDSAGMLTAHAALNRGRDPIPMQVTIIDSDIVLQGDTPDGVMTILLERQNDAERGKLATGRWSIGEKSGELRVRRRG